MSLSKQFKDQMYAVLQEPTLEKFRDFIRFQTGEHNIIDFKKQWIEDASLAKEMLALANSDGGVIVFGIAENEDKSISIEGLPEIKDKAIISNGIKNLISSNLKYDIYDFSYSTSEYEMLKGKNFQILVVDENPEYLPFLAKKESGTLKQNMIYVRRGTSCEIANEEELQNIFRKRLNFMHPTKGEPLDLDEHLKQLKILYNKINKENIVYNEPSELVEALRGLSDVFSFGREKTYQPNPLYPDESYEEFIANMIVEKKNKIKRVLDLY